MLRRHPILAFLALLVSAGLLSLIFFLATFDLNHYRDDLQERLSSALNQPVQLGTASLSLNPGPSFFFTGLRIGEQDHPVLAADGLTLQTELLPLFFGKLSFGRIVLQEPKVRLTLVPSEDPLHRESRPSELIGKILNAIQVHSLEIRQGTLVFNDLRQADNPFLQTLINLDLQALDLYSREKGQLQLSGQLAENPDSRLEATGRLALPTDPALWRQLWLDLSVQLEGINPAPLCRRYAARVGCDGGRGHFALQLSLQGSPRDGLSFSSELQGDSLLLNLSAGEPRSLPLQHLGLAGVWTASEELNRFDKLALQLDELRLTGHFSLQQGEQDPWLAGGLSSQELPLEAIFRRLPPNRVPFPNLFKTHPAEGTLRLSYSRFAGPLSDFQGKNPQQTIKEATLHLDGGQIRLAGDLQLNQIAATATWKDQHLLLSDGSARLLKSPLKFSGSVEEPFGESPTVTFAANGVLPGRNLAQLLHHKQFEPLAAEGPIPLRVSLEGPVSQLEWALQADLQSCRLDYRPLLTKPVGVPTGLRLRGQFNATDVLLTKGILQLNQAFISADGRYSREAPEDYDLQISLADTNLETLLPLLPALEPFQVQGRLAGHYRLQSRANLPLQGRGTLQVSDAGVSFPDVLGGRLQGFSGPLELHEDRIEWGAINGLLGQSAVTLAGKVSKGAPPRVELSLAGDRVRADELVFSSPDAQLRQIKGRLVFNGRQVDFKELQVTLDDDNRYAIEGRLMEDKGYQLHLAVTAAEADIDTVVALWQGPETRPRDSRDQQIKVIVTALVAKGTYQQLQFEEATATVTSTAGLLDITPVDFHTGGGHGRVRITLQRGLQLRQNLTVSGHLSGVESSSLGYGGLIDKNGLLNGTLNGEFHLTGPLDDPFLKTASGDFRVRIKEGVLHRFTFLAKVFSLLNVSQIFALELPDMVEKGMPFSLLEGDFTLRKGVLSTENLFVTSNAMNLSLIGDIDLVRDELDLTLGVKPFGTVDKVVTRIPIAGWLLTGEDKALITAHFEISGSSQAPRVNAIPVTSVSNKVLGIFKRVFGLPGKMITDPREVITGTPQETAP